MYREYKIFKHRPDLKTIAELVSYNSKVLGLDCGDGSLLDFLRKHKTVNGSGIELEQEQIIECVKRGVSVVHGNLNCGLTEIKDKTFDYVVILSQTIQSVERPDKLLKEMIRVGKSMS